MKIEQLPNILIDEYPEDNSDAEICILTRPMYPVPDMSKYEKQIRVYCGGVTHTFLRHFPTFVPKPILCLMPVNQLFILHLSEDRKLRVIAVETDDANGSVMLLMNREGDEEKVLYTGTFIQCHKVLMHPSIHKAIVKRQINAVYLDNTIAGISHLNSLDVACESIVHIIRKKPDYSVDLKTDVLGPMDLLLELARKHGIKVKLTLLQKCVFGITKQLQHFGDQTFNDQKPDLRINYSNHVVPASYYQKLYDEKKIITLQLVISNEPITKTRSTMKMGLVHISYSPHPNRIELNSLVMSIRPKRVYTLAPVDSMGCSAIPRGMTHNGSIEVIDLNGNSENDSQDELDPIIDSFANDILNITEADKNPPAKRSSSVKSFLATSDDDDSDDDDDNKASTRKKPSSSATNNTEMKQTTNTQNRESQTIVGTIALSSDESDELDSLLEEGPARRRKIIQQKPADSTKGPVAAESVTIFDDQQENSDVPASTDTLIGNEKQQNGTTRKQSGQNAAQEKAGPSKPTTCEQPSTSKSTNDTNVPKKNTDKSKDSVKEMRSKLSKFIVPKATEATKRTRRSTKPAFTKTPAFKYLSSSDSSDEGDDGKATQPAKKKNPVVFDSSSSSDSEDSSVEVIPKYKHL